MTAPITSFFLERVLAIGIRNNRPDWEIRCFAKLQKVIKQGKKM